MVMTLVQNFMVHMGCGVAAFGSGVTGDRVQLAKHGSATFIGFEEDGTGTTTYTLREHTAGTGGTSADLAVVADYWEMTHASDILTAGLTFTHTPQTAAATFVATANQESIMIIHVESSQLSDGYSWVSVNVASTKTANGVTLWLLGGTRYAQDVIATATS